MHEFCHRAYTLVFNELAAVKRVDLKLNPLALSEADCKPLKLTGLDSI
jgi:hypothetical protein